MSEATQGRPAAQEFERAGAATAQASFENLKPRPVTPFYPEMSSQAIQPTFGQAMARQITPDQAIKQMAEKMRQIIKSG